jgi:UDP-N-acetylmuramoylalanine--D-glutamate ligase
MGKAVVVGLARSGLGAANLLARMGEEVTVTDVRAEKDLAEFTSKLSPSVNLILGGHPDWLFEDAELVVVSPGVPLGIRPLEDARKAGVRIIGELELAYECLHGVPFYAVTGTNGKSTTVTLLDLMLRGAGKRCLFGGNIGNALTGEILKRANGGGRVEDVDCVVAEVSSFQLEAIERFRPRVASVLNITPDHLDRYGSMAEYRKAKRRIFRNQRRGDWLVLNADDPEAMKLRGSRKNVHFFSRKDEVNGVYLKRNAVLSSEYGPLLGADDIRVKGVHNLENAMAASAMALLAGCPPETVVEALREFPGLEHRLEFVRELDGVRYINDSKGTNTGAVAKSLESFAGPVVLIAGGRDKAGDFSVLRPLMDRVRALVLIGEAREKIRAALSDVVECHMAGSLQDAIGRARAAARAGDVVLLSPACASFDMFRDFEDRGRQFKKLVEELK